MGSKTIAPPKENCPNPKTKPNSNPNPNQGTIFLGGNCLFASNPKTNPNLDPDPNTNWGDIFLGVQLSGYRCTIAITKNILCQSFILFCQTLVLGLH